jgi:hypothetical protein
MNAYAAGRADANEVFLKEAGLPRAVRDAVAQGRNPKSMRYVDQPSFETYGDARKSETARGQYLDKQLAAHNKGKGIAEDLASRGVDTSQSRATYPASINARIDAGHRLAVGARRALERNVPVPSAAELRASPTMQEYLQKARSEANASKSHANYVSGIQRAHPAGGYAYLERQPQPVERPAFLSRITGG